jgi:hypothetical protein
MHYARSKKEIRKIEIEKKKEQKIEKGPRGNVSAQKEKQPAAHLAQSRTGILPSPLSVTARRDPHVSIITSTVSSLLSGNRTRRSKAPTKFSRVMAINP